MAVTPAAGAMPAVSAQNPAYRPASRIFRVRSGETVRSLTHWPTGPLASPETGGVTCAFLAARTASRGRRCRHELDAGHRVRRRRLRQACADAAPGGKGLLMDATVNTSKGCSAPES